jgi:hypothetical protein
MAALEYKGINIDTTFQGMYKIYDRKYERFVMFDDLDAVYEYINQHKLYEL